MHPWTEWVIVVTEVLVASGLLLTAGRAALASSQDSTPEQPLIEHGARSGTTASS